MYKLIFRIYTEFLQLNAKTFFKLEKYLDISQRIYIQMVEKHIKDVQSYH